MGDGSTDGTDESRRRGDSDSRAGSGAADAPARPARADFPPTDGEIAARRLIRGHLDTSGLDPVTAKAVELLAAADMVAAEQYVPNQRRAWRQPLWAALIAVLATNLVTAVALGIVARGQQRGDEEREQIATTLTQTKTIAEAVQSCVDPQGACAQRGQATTAEAVAALNRATLVIVQCADEYDGAAAIDRCVALRLPDRD